MAPSARSRASSDAGRLRHYYVDEAGDAVLFDARGRLIVGAEGCSRFFMLGLLDVPEPQALQAELDALRAALLADPYFKKIPSMQPERRKTALAFHAKDDLPEVRREVFALLMRHRLRFYAVVRSKFPVLAYVRKRSRSHPSYRYHPNELYDFMVRRLFKNHLHKADAIDIYFSRRGNQDRTAALQEALARARESFYNKWHIRSAALITVHPAAPAEAAGLQAVDYFLWALQRLYERREDRYLDFVWPACHMVHDVDDTRLAPYGRYYAQEKPLTIAALPDLPGI